MWERNLVGWHKYLMWLKVWQKEGATIGLLYYYIQINYMTWYIIYLLTAIGLSSGGSTHLHKNNTRNNKNNNGTSQITNSLEECGSCAVFASFTLAFALQLRKKHRKTSVTVIKTSVRVQNTYYQKYGIHITKRTAYILPKVQHTYYQTYSIHITKSTAYILPNVQYTYYQTYSIHITKSTVYILPNVQYTYYQTYSIHITKRTVYILPYEFKKASHI
jgi:hypothetical protein